MTVKNCVLKSLLVRVFTVFDLSYRWLVYVEEIERDDLSNQE